MNGDGWQLYGDDSIYPGNVMSSRFDREYLGHA